MTPARHEDFPAGSNPHSRAERIVFRPRFLRTVAITCAVLLVVSFAALSVALSIIGWTGWRPHIDSVWMNLLGIGMGAAVWRIGAVRAVATDAGLAVRNIVASRSFAWPEIVAVEYAPHAESSWVSLDLQDGTTYAVMAIQSSDGDRARANALELKDLVDRHTSRRG